MGAGHNEQKGGDAYGKVPKRIGTAGSLRQSPVNVVRGFSLVRDPEGSHYRAGSE